MFNATRNKVRRTTQAPIVSVVSGVVTVLIMLSVGDVGVLAVDWDGVVKVVVVVVSTTPI